MAFSKLATDILTSANNSGKRTNSIERLTLHCFVGQVTAKRALEVFQPKEKKASCNYVVGYDGSIGACVDEDNRSWCSSNAENDQKAITIEIASGTVSPYEIRDKAYDATKKLIIDIMRRHGKSRLVYIADKYEALSYEVKPCELLITMHKWFANKSCPGEYIISILPDLVDAVNKELASDDILYEPIYRVQVGAFSNRSNAARMLEMVTSADFVAYINEAGGLYRVQVGAYRDYRNAAAMMSALILAGFDAYVKEGER